MNVRHPRRYSFHALMDRLCSGVWCVMEINESYIFVAKRQHK